jgi:hypothetical protein
MVNDLVPPYLSAIVPCNQGRIQDLGLRGGVSRREIWGPLKVPTIRITVVEKKRFYFRSL